MVAFCSSRRRIAKSVTLKQPSLEALAACGESARPGDDLEAAASRRDAAGVQTYRDGGGEIIHLRIGRWRVIAAGPQRRIAEVRELACDKVAVRIDRYADSGDRPTSQIWQLYSHDGRLEAALQTTPDGRFAILTNYETRQAARLMRNSKNELETVEAWRI